MEINNRQDWLSSRMLGIGGSEAAAICNVSPYMTPVDLWMLKTGKIKQEDLENKPFVQKGIKSEQHIIALFQIDYPEYSLEHREFDIRWSDSIPFVFTSLDAEATNNLTGQRGTFEAKRTEVYNKKSLEKWGKYNPDTKEFDQSLPKNYYIQMLHSMLATGYEYGILKARIYITWQKQFIEPKPYILERKDFTDEIEKLLEKEEYFWDNYIVKDIRPPLKLDIKKQ